MAVDRIALIAAGALSVAVIGVGASMVHGPRLVARLDHAAHVALNRSGGASVRIGFIDSFGWLTRHPTMSGGEGLDDATRARAEAAVANIAGIGGVGGQTRQMPLWLEIEVLLLMTYGAGLGFGWLVWGLARQARR